MSGVGRREVGEGSKHKGFVSQVAKGTEVELEFEFEGDFGMRGEWGGRIIERMVIESRGWCDPC